MASKEKTKKKTALRAEHITPLATAGGVNFFEGSYKLLFMKNPVPMWVYDRKTFRFLEVNEAAIKHYGYSEAEFLSKTIFDIRPKSDTELLLDCIKKFDNSKDITFQGCWRHQKKDGAIIDVEVTVEKLALNGSEIYLSVINDVTSRIRSERLEGKLKESEESYKDLVDSLTIGVIIYQNEKIVFANRYAFILMGYTDQALDDIQNKSILNFVAPEYHEYVKRRSTEIINDGKHIPFSEIRVKSPGGEELTLEVKSARIKYKGKDAVQVILRDISDKKSSELRLKSSEEKFRRLSEATNEGIIIHNKGIIVEANEAVCRITGYTPCEVISKNMISFAAPEFRAMIMQNIAEDYDQPYEAMVLHKDGSRIVVEVMGKTDPVTNNRIVIMRDVSKKKEAERALRESEQKYRSLFERNMAGVFQTTAKGKMINCNNALAKYFGYSSAEEMMHLNAKELYFTNNEREEYINVLRSQKSVNNYQIRHKRKDGGELWVLANVSIIKNPETDEEIIEGTLVDITGQLLAQQTLQASEKRLRMLADAAIEGIIFCENEIIIDANDRFALMHGYAGRRDVIGKKINTFFEIRNINGLSANKTLRTEISSRKKDGLLIILEASIGSVPFNENEIKVFGVYDISDRKQYERELQQRKEEYKNLIENSPVGIFIIQDENIAFANNSAIKLLDIYNEYVSNQPLSLWKFVVPEQREGIKKKIKEVFDGKKNAYNELKILNKSGKTVEIEISASVIDYFGSPALQVVAQDISYRKQLEREQLRAEVAEQTNIILKKEIADRIKAQRQLREAQKFTRNIIDSSLDMICAVDKDNKIIEFNEAAQKVFEYSPEEVMGKSVEMLYKFEEEYIKVGEALSKNGSFVGEVVNISKYGKPFITFISASALRNHKGEFIGTMGVSRDITEVKEAEIELKRSREHYKGLFNQALIGIAKVGLDGRFIQPNQKLCEIFGYTVDELSTKTFQDLTHSDDLNRSVEQQQRMMRGEIDNFSTEKRYIHKDGHVIFANLSVSVVRGEKGKPEYFVSVFEDISDRKMALQQSDEQSAKLKAIFDSSTHLIWTINRNYELTSFNRNHLKRITKFWGREPKLYDKVITPSRNLATDKKAYDKVLKRIEQAFNGEPAHYEIAYNGPDGNTYWQETYVNPIVLENGAIEELSFIAQDVTEKNIAEKKLKESLREKEVLLKEVHHRVKNNLQVISSILNLQKSHVNDEKTLSVLRESQNRIKSMAFIHESLYQTKDFSQINFSEYVANLSKNLVHSYGDFENLIELRLQVEEVYLNLDLAIPCGLIINELVSNSLKYGFEAGKSGNISVSIKKDDGRIIMKIGDDGRGFVEKMDFRNTQTLGLQLVVALVEQISGQIKLERRKKGVNYTIEFKQQ